MIPLYFEGRKQPGCKSLKPQYQVLNSNMGQRKHISAFYNFFVKNNNLFP